VIARDAARVVAVARVATVAAGAPA
jgi:hypothetical protein